MNCSSPEFDPEEDFFPQVGPSFSLGKKEPSGCRWVFGDPSTRDWHYCQRPLTSLRYCTEHAAVSYRKPLPAGAKKDPQS